MGLRMDHQRVCFGSDVMPASMAMVSFPLLPSQAVPRGYFDFPVAPTPARPSPAEYLPIPAVQLPHVPLSQQHGEFALPPILFPLPSASLGTRLQGQQMPVPNQVSFAAKKAFWEALDDSFIPIPLRRHNTPRLQVTARDSRTSPWMGRVIL
ncbi:unnamed protein product [Victoria cruziana]